MEAYARGDFFEAHEHWEDIWRALPEGDERRHLQGLIQIAAAMHKRFVMRSASGAARLLERARAKISDAPPSMFGVDAAKLTRALEDARRALEAEARGEGEMRIEDAPKLDARPSAGSPRA